MRFAGVCIAALAVACSGGDKLINQPPNLSAPARARPAPITYESDSGPRAERFDPRAESSEALTVWGAPPAKRVAEYRAAVARVRARAARSRDRFHLVFEPPFVVVGDEGRQQVAERATRTVRWAVQLLKKAYFEKDPDKVIEIWLFGSRSSYRRNARALFDESPDTPYGYYSPADGALVMNIATGGGTLVHEIVHPFIEANVPNAPAWLNEGMGSLYEASAERDGHIVGVLNWRLPGLQRALRDDRVPSFRELTSMGWRRFYGDNLGVHYAQARYLLYYLQENDLLHRFFREFLARRKQDKTGYQALVSVLGEKDMNAFQQRWAGWVERLRYRR